MKKLILPLILLSLICGITSCEKDLFDRNRLTLTVASVGRMISPYQIASSLYFVKAHPQDEWVSFDGIEGFDYEEGYEYVIRVKREKWHNGEIMDAGMYRYILLKVISKTKKNSKGPFEEVFYIEVASRKNDNPETMVENPYYARLSPLLDWDIFPSIIDLDYEEGHEYSLLVMRRVETAQSLLKVTYIHKETFKKEAKESQGLPD